MESNYLHHYLMVLETENLVFRRSVLLTNYKPAVQTNLCILKRLANEADEEDDDNVVNVDRRSSILCNLIAAKPDMTVAIPDFKLETRYLLPSRRQFKALMKRLEDRGIIRRFHARDESNHVVYCAQLLKPYEPLQRTADAPKKPGFTTDLPLDYQLYKMIEASGDQGIVRTELKLKGFTHKLVSLRTPKLVYDYGVVSFTEMRGKNSNYKYAVREHGDAAIKKSQTVREEEEMREKEREKKEKQEKAKAKKASQVEDDDQDIPSSKPTKRSRNVDAEETPKKKTKKSPAKKSPPKKSPKKTEDDDADEDEDDDDESTDVRHIEQIRRRKIIMEMLNQEKVVSWIHLKEKIGEQLKYVQQHKTFKRVLDAMERDGRLKTVSLTLPLTSGMDKKINVAYLPSMTIESPEIQDFIKKAKAAEFQINSKHASPNGGRPLRPAVSELPVLKLDRNMAVVDAKKSDAPLLLRKYGYINAKMIRTKMMHQLLWQNVYGGSDKEQTPTGDFTWSYTMKKMPILFYMNVLGLTVDIDGIIDMAKKGMTIEQAPIEVRQTLLNRRLFGTKLNTVSNSLSSLKLIRMNPDNTVHLFKSVTLMDRTVNPPEEVTHVFNTMTAVSKYWSDLEYISVNSEEPEDAPYTSKDNARNWTTRTAQISRSQRLHLTYADLDPASETFKDDCQRMAAELDLTFAQIADFQRRKRIASEKRAKAMEDSEKTNQGSKKKVSSHVSAYEQKKSKLPSIKQEPQMQSMMRRYQIESIDDRPDDDIQEIVDLENIPAEEIEREQAKETSVIRDASNADPEPDVVDEDVVDDTFEDEIPDGDQDEHADAESSEQPEQGESRKSKGIVDFKKRHDWKHSEDQLLLQTYSDFMVKSKRTENDLDLFDASVMKMWPQIAKILGRATQQCSNRFRRLMTTESNRRVIRNTVADKISRGNQELAKYNLSDADLFDKSDIIAWRQHTSSHVSHPLLAEIFRIVLTTPEEVYVPKDAAKALRKYSDDEIGDCFDELLKLHWIHKTKGSGIRGYRSSMLRHGRWVAGNPRMQEVIKGMTNLEDHFGENDKAVFPSGDQIKPGFMAHFLNLISKGELEVTIPDRLLDSIGEAFKEAHLENHEDPKINNEENRLLLPEWDIIVNKTDKYDDYLKWKSDMMNRIRSEQKADEDLQRLRSNPPTLDDVLSQMQMSQDDAEILRQIDATILKDEFSGSSIASIQKSTNLSEDKILPMIDILVQNARIMRCTWNGTYVYVPSSSSRWVLGDSHSPIEPWTNLDGSIDESKLNGSRQSIFNQIWKSPGISRSKLEQFFHDTFFKLTIVNILNDLEKLKAITSEVIQTKKVGLFGTSLGPLETVYSPAQDCYEVISIQQQLPPQNIKLPPIAPAEVSKMEVVPAEVSEMEISQPLVSTQPENSQMEVDSSQSEK
eukprot:TRINITY_DN5201_c0_g1_i2.p1 TRINITY_DN5201_c0_g1~~TRINITY_DN5201_c0_g1_i2.p1  ORF type:complete len:1566 (-),score=479.16 TRINITY_DN5201_c0_g1_i2:8-4249(-)